MILKNSCAIYSRTVAQDSEHRQVSTYTLAETIMANVNPTSLSEMEIKEYGLTDIHTDARKMLFYPDDTVFKGYRVVVDSGAMYEIRALHKWPTNYQALLIPVQGGVT